MRSLRCVRPGPWHHEKRNRKHRLHCGHRWHGASVVGPNNQSDVSNVSEAMKLVASIRDGSFAREKAIEEVQNLHLTAGSLPELTAAAKRSGDLGLWQQVLKVLEDTQHLQLAPDIILYGAVMNGCEKSHQWQLALAVFEQAQLEGLSPSLVAAGAALSAMGRGSLWPHALDFLEQLPRWKLRPNVFTYNASISACERGQQWEKALDLLKNMKGDAKPDIVSFNTAMNACQKAEEWRLALQVFGSITDASPTEITYNILINASHKASHWVRALECLEEMRWKHLVPTTASHAMAMKACLRGSSWSSALQLYQMLPSHEQDGPVLRSLVMQSLGEASAWPEALQLLQPGRDHTDQGCFNAAMRALEISSQWSQALQLIEVMQQRDRLQVVPMTMAMSACKRATEWAAVLFLLRDVMPSLGLEPSLPCMSTALGALLQAGRCSEALQLLQASSVLASDGAECNRAFKDFATSHSWEEALALAEHMRQQGLMFTEGNRVLEESLRSRSHLRTQGASRPRPPPPPPKEVKSRPAGPRPAEEIDPDSEPQAKNYELLQSGDVRTTILRMSKKGMPMSDIGAFCDVAPAEVVRILAQEEALGPMVKRLTKDPDELCCSISQARFVSPVVAAKGWQMPESLTGATLENVTLHPNQNMTSKVISFQEETLAEILSVAPLLLKAGCIEALENLLPRALSFVRPLLDSDASARKKLLRLLSIRIRMPLLPDSLEASDSARQELHKLLHEVADDQIEALLCGIQESELRGLLAAIDWGALERLQKIMKASCNPCKDWIDQEVGYKRALLFYNYFRLDLKRFDEYWQLLIENYQHAGESLLFRDERARDRGAKAAALVLATFPDRVGTPLKDIDYQVLEHAHRFLTNREEAIDFAKRFFKYKIRIADKVAWPPASSGRIFLELAARERKGKEKFDLLVRAYNVCASDTRIRSALLEQLHCKILRVDSFGAGTVPTTAKSACSTDSSSLEELFLKVSLEEERQIPTDLIDKLTLKDTCLQHLNGDLLPWAQQLGHAGRPVDGARLAVLLGQRWARKGDKERAVEAFCLAFRLDTGNPDAASGLLDFAELVIAANQAARHKVVTLRGNQCQSTLLLDWDLREKDFTNSEGVDSPKFRISRRVLAWISIFPQEPCPKCILNLNRATDVKLRDAKIDLHGLPVEVAKVAVQVALEDLVLGAPGSPAAPDVGDLIIVTGVGNNSPGRVALVRPAVISFLRDELSIRVLEQRRDGPGRLRVPSSELRKLRGVPRPGS
eukprot:s3043_g4.t1